MLARILWSGGDAQRKPLRALLVAVTQTAFLAYMPVAFRITNVAGPYSYDRYLALGVSDGCSTPDSRRLKFRPWSDDGIFVEYRSQLTRALQRPGGLLRNAAGSAIVAGVAFSTVPVALSQDLGQRPFLAFAFLGLVAVQFSLRPALLELALTVLAAGCSCAAYILLGGGFSHEPVFRAIGVLSFLGAGSLAAMTARLLCGGKEAWRKHLRALLVAITPIAFVTMMPLAFRTTPGSLDHYLYAFDGRFGFEPAFAVGSLFATVPFLKTFCAVVYAALPLAIVCVWIVAPDVADEPGLIRTFLMTGVLGLLLFRLLPAAGPIYAFPGAWPAHPPAIADGFVTPIAMGRVWLNAMPSVSAAWALLIFWRTRRNRRLIRSAAGAFLFLVLLAPLGLGEHYLIDLVVAIPFAVFVRALWMTRASFSLSRISALACNAALVGIWLILLRSGALLRIAPLGAWIMAVLTVAFALWLDAGVRTYRLRTARKRLGDAVTAASRLTEFPAAPSRRRFPRHAAIVP